MKVAFLTENMISGKIPRNFENMRTEFAWMVALNADHYNIHDYVLKSVDVTDYDHVFIIFPKGEVFVAQHGGTLPKGINPAAHIFHSDIVQDLKENNAKVHFIQEGPHWWWDNYTAEDQFALFGQILRCDTIYAHNQYDIVYYQGIFPDHEVLKIDTLLIEDLIRNIKPLKRDKVIIGGNFASWYGGFESFLIAQEFDMATYAQTSHATRFGETKIMGLQHLPRLSWIDWMKELSTFKYAVHLMPTVAAGTFALNCAYFGIPCIGNIDVDTQLNCFPELSVSINDVVTARKIANKLHTDSEFYNEVSNYSMNVSKTIYSEEVWKRNMI